MASSSTRLAIGWKTIFRLGNEPLPVTLSVRTWAQGEGAQVAQSLEGLQLPKDVHFFSGGADESLAVRLQWHTIAIIHFAFLLFHGYMFIFFFHTY